MSNQPPKTIKVTTPYGVMTIEVSLDPPPSREVQPTLSVVAQIGGVTTALCLPIEAARIVANTMLSYQYEKPLIMLPPNSRGGG